VLLVHILVGFQDVGEARYDTAASGRLFNFYILLKILQIFTK